MVDHVISFIKLSQNNNTGNYNVYRVDLDNNPIGILLLEDYVDLNFTFIDKDFISYRERFLPDIKSHIVEYARKQINPVNIIFSKTLTL